MKKKLSLILVSGMLLSHLSISVQGFSDVNQGDWYYNDVTAMTNGGYLAGKTPTNFGAADALSNAEFCAMLSYAFYGETLAVFLTNNTGAWYLPHLATVYTRGGMDNTQIGNYYNHNHLWGDYVDQSISRYDMASMITCLLENRGVPALNDSQVETVLAGINDSIATEYRHDVATAFHYGFLNGYPDGGFYGSEPVIRAAAAVVLASLVRSDLIEEENVSNYYTFPDDSAPEVEEEAPNALGLHPFVVEVFELVNQERAKNGLYAYTLDVTLCKLAQFKSDEMSALNYLDHTSPTYGAFSNILSNNGIYAIRARENLARGQRSAEEVVLDWMNSTDHRTNLMASDVTKVGIGFTEDGHYWSQLFTDSSANTEDGVSGELGSGGSSGGTGSQEDYEGERYAMEIPFFQYDNYLEVGYRPQDYPIFIPVNNTGDFTLDFTDLHIYGANADAFSGFVSAASIPVGGTGYVIIEPQADLAVGQYSAIVEFAVKNLPSLFQTVTVYVSEIYEAPSVNVPESEYIPEPDFEIPELNFDDDDDDEVEVLPENDYTLSFSGDYEAGVENITLFASAQSQWHYETYEETKVVLQLSAPLPEGTEIDSVTTSTAGASITSARLENDRSQIHLTFSGLSYSDQTVAVDVSCREGYRVVLNAAPVGLTILINGASPSLGDISPYSLEVGDTVEVLMPDVNTAEYGFVVKNSSANQVNANKTSSYGARSSGIYTITDQDLFFSVGKR